MRINGLNALLAFGVLVITFMLTERFPDSTFMLAWTGGVIAGMIPLFKGGGNGNGQS